MNTNQEYKLTAPQISIPNINDHNSALSVEGQPLLQNSRATAALFASRTRIIFVIKKVIRKNNKQNPVINAKDSCNKVFYKNIYPYMKFLQKGDAYLNIYTIYLPLQ